MRVETSLSRARPGTGAAVDFSGIWKNELGSEMTLTQNGDKLAGDYDSTVSSDGTQTTGHLRGYCDGDLIAFVVHWDEFQAITSWVGQVDADQVSIRALWQMTKQAAEGQEWASINAGFDAFDRVA